MEAWTIVLICCWVLRTIMIPRTREKKFLHCGVWKGSYTMEAWTIVLICCWGIEHHNRFLRHGSVEKVEVWKGSYTMEAWMIVLICC